MTARDVMDRLTADGIRIEVKIDPISEERRFFAYPTPGNPVLPEHVELLKESREKLLALYEEDATHFRWNYVTAKMIFWNAEWKTKGADFTLSNWRTKALSEMGARAARRYAHGHGSIDEVEMYYEAFGKACKPSGRVREDDQWVITVTPQTHFSDEELGKLCDLMGIRKEEYVDRFL